MLYNISVLQRYSWHCVCSSLRDVPELVQYKCPSHLSRATHHFDVWDRTTLTGIPARSEGLPAAVPRLSSDPPCLDASIHIHRHPNSMSWLLIQIWPQQPKQLQDFCYPTSKTHAQRRIYCLSCMFHTLPYDNMLLHLPHLSNLVDELAAFLNKRVKHTTHCLVCLALFSQGKDHFLLFLYLFLFHVVS
jgi:hypothetical protein